MKPNAPHSVRRIVLSYALFAGLWILLSDRLLAALILDARLLTTLQSYKGWVFVLVSALLLDVLLRRDITRRQQAEAALRKSNRALKVISECNQVLVRATTETELLQEICGLLVDHGGYRMAWVGFAEQDETKSVRPVAQAGFNAGYLDTVNISWADTECGRGPTGTSIRTGQPVIARDIPTDPAYGPWRAAAIQRGYTSSVALPLDGGGRVFGALMIYSAQMDAFDAEELALLGELAGDLAYGLTTLRTRAGRERAEEALRHSQALVRAVTEGTSDAVYVKDTQGRYLMANAGTLRLLGKSLAEVIGQDDTALFPLDDARQIMAGDRRVMDSGAARTYEECITILGQPRTFLSTKDPWRDAEGRVVGLFGIARDISERKQAEEALRQSEATVRNKLQAIVEPDGDIGALELSDIIDAEALRSMMEDFHRVTGMLGAVLDLSGKVLVAVGWQDICVKFHRCHPDTAKNCIESDTLLSQDVAPGAFRAYRCKNHMWDLATPLMVGGQHMGNVYFGQFFYEDETPDVEVFRAQARHYGFDEAEYLAALGRVPRFSREQVDAGMRFYARLASLVSSLSYNAIKQSRMLAERQRTEAAIQRERGFSEAVLNSLPGVLYCYDESFRFLLWNRNFERVTGYTGEEIARMSPLDFFSGADKQLLATRIQEVFEQGVSEVEADFVSKDGTHTPYYFTGLTTEIEGRRHLVGVGVDISQRKRAEAALAESEARFRAIAAHTPDHVMIQDRDLRYQMVINPQLGLTEADMVGKTDQDFLRPQDAENLTTIKRKVLETGEPVRLELPIQNLKGETEFFEGAYVPRLDDAGRANGVIGYFRNITDRKRVEAERDAHAQRNENLVRALGQVVYEHDVPADHITWSGETEKVLGYTPAELGHTEADWLRLVHPEDAAKVKAQFAADSRKGMFEVECRYRYKGGHYVWTFDRGVIQRNAEGCIVRVSGILRDITERKQAEAALRESHARLKKVLEVETVGVMFWDLISGRMTDANDTFLKVMGYSRREVEAGELNWQKLTPPEFIEVSLAEIRKFQATGRVGPYEKEYLRKDGTRNWFVFAGSSLGGNTCVEFCVDISDRKRAEAARIESEERLRLALDAAHMGTFDWELPANRIKWSHWHEELWGFQPGEFGGTYEAFAERVHPEDMPGINAEVARCIAARAPFTREFRVVWPDGSIHWIIAVGEFTFDAGGRPSRMRGVVKEITDRKRLEQSLHELTARTLRLQDDERRRLARELHDTTAQNLAALNMNLAVLEQSLPPETGRLHDLLMDCQKLTDLSAQEIRTLAYLLHPPLLEEFGLVRAVRDYAEGFAERSGIRVELDLDVDLDRLPADDELALFRVLQESLGNVHRHSGSPVARIRLATEQNEVCLEIADEGRGLPAGAGADAPAVGVGILGMRERLQQLGGRLGLVAGLPGVRVRAMLPHRRTRV